MKDLLNIVFYPSYDGDNGYTLSYLIDNYILEDGHNVHYIRIFSDDTITVIFNYKNYNTNFPVSKSSMEYSSEDIKNYIKKRKRILIIENLLDI